MTRLMKRVLLVGAALVVLVIGAAFLWFYGDQDQYKATRNPCERACLNDSGGFVGCRQECASHPFSYGPNVFDAAAADAGKP